VLGEPPAVLEARQIGGDQFFVGRLHGRGPGAVSKYREENGETARNAWPPLFGYRMSNRLNAALASVPICIRKSVAIPS
jgi:hypothetical protein